MIHYVQRILSGQLEAALCMLHECVRSCPPEHWEGRIANDTFRQVAYHALFYFDLYLSPNEDAFVLRDLHERGGDERGPTLSPGLSRDDTLAYVAICREKLHTAVEAETRESLEGPCGFSWRKTMSRGELHIYNIRHVQHHAGAMGSYLRRIGAVTDVKALSWVATGWR